MSVELYVYCYGDSLAPVADLSELLDLGGWSLRLVHDQAGTLTACTQPTLRNARAIAWPADSAYAEALEQVLADQSASGLQRHYELEHCATATVCLDSGFEADPEEVDELTEAGIDPKFVSAIAQAKNVYTVRTTAMRNGLSLEFQEVLWKAVAVAACGLAHDPTDDTFDDCDEGVVDQQP